MNRQSLFIRQCLTACVALIFAFSFTLTGVAFAEEVHGKPARTQKAAAPHALTLPAEPLTATTLADAKSELAAFAASVLDGRAGVLRGVYVPGVLALRVVQQTGAFSVNMTPGIATQFSAASDHGVTGLLADNVASGVLFFSLAPGQEVTLIYGDGQQRQYRIVEIARYQALSPTNPYSDFLDLTSGEQVSATNLFSQMYSGGDKVTFQTCLAKDGLMQWGRLFVTAHLIA